MQSPFAAKILRGEVPDTADWNTHLKAAHAVPGMTPNAFANFRTREGLNSYEVLAAVHPDLPRASKIIDLACGDGHLAQYLLPRMSPSARLLGIDMSAGELAQARQQVKDPRVAFAETDAAHIPAADATVDHIYCHMAFMLMAPLDPVISELTRVLRPGGAFTAMIGNARSLETGILADFFREFGQFLRTNYPAALQTKAGDSRTQTEDGLKALFFHENGFSSIRTQVIDLRVTATPEAAWNLVRNMYFVALVPAPEQELIQRNFLKILTRSHDQEIRFPMKLIEVRRLNP